MRDQKVFVQLYLLRDKKSQKNVCKRLNKNTQCKEKISCEKCPITLFSNIEYLVNMKRLTLGEAYNSSMRSRQ